MTEPNNKVMPLPLWLYVLGLVLFMYLFFTILRFSADTPGNILLAGMYFIEFGVHEASHLIVMFLPPVLVAAAGSVGEISFVALMTYAAVKAKSYFAACFTGLWLMLAFRSVGLYMADARAQQLPLLGPGETVQHDWNFVFSQLGWLNADVFIGTVVQAIGVVIGIISLLGAFYLVYRKQTRQF
ncbi:MAG: hypothetical protein WBK76_05080 [Candidatus Saccharimonadales bacterium]